jgi:hypothetical protein
MDRDTTHEEYDQALELLATPPRYPKAAPISALADDLGYAYQSAVQSAADSLAVNHGIVIERFTVKSLGRCLAVHHDSWALAQRVARDYWQRVYGGEPVEV